MADTSKYFRPEWTCGRYNREKRAAIYYNLIEGMSYYFEEESAEIIGKILESRRNSTVSLRAVAESIGYPQDIVKGFLDSLKQLSLLSGTRPTKEAIINYRKAHSEWKRAKLQTENKTIQDKLPFRREDAETAYLRKVGGITQAMLELTYNCSEKCIHCYNIGATRNNEEISHRGDLKELNLDDYRNIIDQLYNIGCFKICLSGGDPFSKPIIWDIIQYLYDKEIAFDIYTNGQGLVGKVKRLVSYHPRLMSISLYADNAFDHDYITRLPGSWQHTVEVMNQLGDYSVPMDIKVCIMRSNLKSYRGVENLAKKAGGKALYEACINDSVEGDKCVSKYLRLTPAEYEIIMRDESIGLYVGPEAPNFGKQEHELNKPQCEGGRAAICIDPEGNVMPCSAFHLKFGNLRDHTLEEIISKSKALKEWSESTIADTDE
ncbi:MAG: radical SAM protein, partial [Muribaculaceae bacterium]|nr:radical SAM protein [Muribaculaceae bacterium]